jgi:peptidoglycan/xylan/chitin deacetylase (PgdA/CDA1 family)
MSSFKKSVLLSLLPVSFSACTSFDFATMPDRTPASLNARVDVDEVDVRDATFAFREQAGATLVTSDDGLEDMMLDGLAQSYIQGEILMKELDERFARGETLQDILKVGKGERNLYVEMLALRAFKEETEASLSGRGAIQFNQALEKNAPKVSWVSRIQLKIQNKIARHPGQESVLKLAFQDLEHFANELGNRFKASHGHFEHYSAEPVDSSELSVQELRALREKKDAFSDESFREFLPSDGEAGVNVKRLIKKAAGEAGPEFSKMYRSFADRLPAQAEGLKIYPSLGGTGSITGNGFPKGVWSLTYDDGPAGTTPGILNNLEKYGIKATFFMLSQQIDGPKKFPQHAQREVKEGHATACHSYSHPQVNTLGPTARKHEIEDAARMFEKVLGRRPDFFRLPYGAGVSVQAVRQDIVKSCMVHVFWNVDTLDWHDKDPDTIFRRAVQQVDQLGRGVILFHDIHAQSVIASEKLMGYLKEKGVRLVTIPEIVKEINGGRDWSCKLGW